MIGYVASLEEAKCRSSLCSLPGPLDARSWTASRPCFPANVRLAEDQWLAASEGVTAQSLSEQLGVKRNGIPSVVVFRVSSYFGMQSTDVWDWIRAHWEGGNGG